MSFTVTFAKPSSIAYADTKLIVRANSREEAKRSATVVLAKQGHYVNQFDIISVRRCKR